ncbi:MAG: hypothetical protein ACI841_000218 [Planctomycetota bacterium]|jgi:hypothetical protein
MNSSRSALRLLLWLKLRAWNRTGFRRLSSPTGFLFALVGIGLVGLWVVTLLMRTSSSSEFTLREYELEPFVRAVMMMLAIFTILGSLSHRGLYLPKSELERLLSAPIPRSDLVRYRMLVNVARTFTFATITGLVFSARLPERSFAVPGLVISMLTLPLIGQAAALVFGDAENRLGRVIAGLPISLLRIGVGVFFWLLVMMLFFPEEVTMVINENFPAFRHPFQQRALWEESGTEALLLHPALTALTLPTAPWSKMILASSWAGFLGALSVCVGLWLVIFEAVARLPIDFRTLSLDTSADVAKRLDRLRSGRGMVNSTRISQRSLGWRVPWFFGKGPFGAVAWLKSCAIIRKARGTMVFYTFVMFVLIFVSMVGGLGLESGVNEGAILIALLGTVYLGMGLRFDFRSDLDQMELIKAWPLPNWKLFLATILPEVALISGLVGVAVLVRTWLVGVFPLSMFGLLGLIPTAALLWTSLDNVVFLYAPVRYAPGSGGSMQFAGRSMVLVMLRMLLLASIGLVAALAMFGVRSAALGLGIEYIFAMGMGAMSAALVVFSVNGLLIYMGGRALARFDVTRAIQ